MSGTELDNLLALFEDRENINNLKLGVALIKTDKDLYKGVIKTYTNVLFAELTSYDIIEQSMYPNTSLLLIGAYCEAILYNLKLKYEHIRTN